MRFDDSLETVLSADMSSPIGAELAWRQLVDLVGRGRVTARDDVFARLRSIRSQVPPPVRAASARALATATPPLALIAVFAEDEIAIAAPVLRSAQLSAAEWADLLPDLTPTARSILRHRRDLTQELETMLASYGSVDFVLPPPVPEDAVACDPTGVAERETAQVVLLHAPQTIPQGVNGPFEIAELVGRINAYRRDQEAAGIAPDGSDAVRAVAEPVKAANRFRFETDVAGIIRWVDGVSRSAVIGMTLAGPSPGAIEGGVDRAVLRQRGPIADARLLIGGLSEAAGEWRISATPAFDRTSGRFTGYRGSARRLTVVEVVAPAAPSRNAVADALRQLVHELRTPTNAIAGFAEMIETQMLGPVPAVYRAHAAAIRSQTHDLLGAIEDMDTAARIETKALDLRNDDVPVAPLLERIAADLAPLASLRGATLDVAVADSQIAIRGDGRAVERLIARLLATLVAAGGVGERIAVVAALNARGEVALVFDRPVALRAYSNEALLTIDAETETNGGPLLGTGFALRLARNLATELRGELAIGANYLTLRLPAVEAPAMDRAQLINRDR